MRIGLAFDLKSDPPSKPLVAEGGAILHPHLPDDFQEEFDSPVTIEAIAGVLRDLGHEVQLLGDGRELVERVLLAPPDIVFNIAEGHGIARTREARVPAFLEMLGIPYTGSDPLTLAATLDKDCAKRLVQSAGVAVPRGVVVSDLARDLADSRKELTTLPVLAKPAWEGSSKGIRGCSLITRWEDVWDVVQSLREDHRQPILVEEFIGGDELTVGITGNDPPRIIGIMRVLPRQATQNFVYSLEVKRDFECLVRYESPPSLPKETLQRVADAALTAYRVLGCQDVARVDFRLRDGVPYFLEVNPLPGLNPDTSDLVILARLCGWTYPRLIQAILQAALDRINPSAEDSQPTITTS